MCRTNIKCRLHVTRTVPLTCRVKAAPLAKKLTYLNLVPDTSNQRLHRHNLETSELENSFQKNNKHTELQYTWTESY